MLLEPDLERGARNADVEPTEVVTLEYLSVKGGSLVGLDVSWETLLARLEVREDPAVFLTAPPPPPLPVFLLNILTGVSLYETCPFEPVELVLAASSSGRSLVPSLELLLDTDISA